jgi:3-isopropylmalate dehydrogenase
VWSLVDFGLRCVIAPSFGDIFRANCFQNGVLPVRLERAEVQRLAAELERADVPVLTVDLRDKTIRTPEGRTLTFDIEDDRRDALLQGLDEIGMTLRQDGDIAAFQSRDAKTRPWVYRPGGSDRPARLLILAGDGIGPEIMAEVRRVVEWLVSHRGLRLDLREELFGIAAWKAHANLMREETWSEILEADAILFGAIGSPDYDAIPPEHRKVDYLLRMRRELDLFTNLRPIRMLPALSGASTLRPDVIGGCDMLIVRELAGGIYFGEPRGVQTLEDGRRRGTNTLVYCDEIARIARVAFQLARGRRGRLCSVDKANVLETGALWRDVVKTVGAEEFPDVELSHMYVDNAAMQLVRAPRQFDVIVTENLFGDILSDCAAMVAGSLGMLPSASLSAPDENGRRHALYEPIHGSAPDIAGKGIANPLGAILSFALCLRHSLGLPQDADRLETAVANTIARGARTADFAGPGEHALSTVAMGSAILEELENSFETY